MTALGFDAHSRIKAPIASGMPEVKADADFKKFDAASCNRYQFLPRDLHLYAARIAAAESKTTLFKWLAAAVCVAGIVCNAIVVFSTVLHIGNSLQH